MPYLIPATNNIFGLQPANGPQGRVNLYPVSSTEAVNILIGDALVWTSAATVRAAITGDVSSAYAFAGVAAGALSTASYSAATYNLPVYDDPQQIFAIAITTSLGMTITDMFKVFTFLTSSTGTGIPSTAANVGRSKHAMQALAPTLASSVFGYLKMVGLHPVEALGPSGFVVTTSIGKPQKYLVTPNWTVPTIIPITT